MLTIQYRRLDKIGLLRRYTTLESKEDFLGSFSCAKSFSEGGMLKEIKKNKYRTTFTIPYAGKNESTALNLTFSSVKGDPALSIEFTPRKLTIDEWADVQSWFQVLLGVGEVWDKFEISKMEMALDINQPFHSLLCIAPGISSSNKKFQSSGTLYLGRRYGRRSFAIYDKQKQLKEVKGKELFKPLTRIEARHTSMKLKLSEFGKIQSPFGKLLALRKDVLETLREENKHDTGFTGFCNLIDSGVLAHEAYQEQSKAIKKRIVSILKPRALPLNPKNDEVWDLWLAKQKELLSFIKAA